MWIPTRTISRMERNVLRTRPIRGCGRQHTHEPSPSKTIDTPLETDILGEMLGSAYTFQESVHAYLFRQQTTLLMGVQRTWRSLQLTSLKNACILYFELPPMPPPSPPPSLCTLSRKTGDAGITTYECLSPPPANDVRNMFSRSSSVSPDARNDRSRSAAPLPPPEAGGASPPCSSSLPSCGTDGGDDDEGRAEPGRGGTSPASLPVAATAADEEAAGLPGWRGGGESSSSQYIARLSTETSLYTKRPPLFDQKRNSRGNF